MSYFGRGRGVRECPRAVVPIELLEGRVLMHGGSHSVADPGELTTNATGTVVYFSDTQADAKEAGLDKATWVVSRTGSTSQSLTVKYTIGGTATNGVDYQSLSGSIIIAAGRTSANLVVVPKDDTAVEGTETVNVTLAGGTGYSVGSPSAVSAPLLDNDSNNSLGTLSFRSIASNPMARAEALGGAVNGKLYVLGGLHTVNGKIVAIKRCDVYDPATNTWRRLRDMPFTPITHAGTAIDGKYIWFVGNYLGNHPGPGNKAVYRYDTSTDSWKRGPDLPLDRGAGAAAIAGRKLHYFGGLGADRGADQSDHFVLNLDNIGAGWQRKASLPSGRNHVSGAAVNGKVYVIGGQTDEEDNQTALKSVYRYDATTNKWTQVASLPTVRSHTTEATFTYKGRIIVVGGEVAAGTPRREVFAYDPATNKWSQIGLLPSARSTMVAGIINGKLYASTGNSPSATSTSWVGTFS